MKEPGGGQWGSSRDSTAESTLVEEISMEMCWDRTVPYFEVQWQRHGESLYPPHQVEGGGSGLGGLAEQLMGSGMGW